MGTPRFYYYPQTGGSLEEATLNRALSRLDQLDQPQRIDVYAGDQGAWGAFYGTRRRVRLTWERISLLTAAGREDYRTLQAVIAHLQIGGYVGFSADHAKTWVASPGIGVRVWGRGASSLFTSANLLSAWAPLATLSSGDQVAIESHPIFGQAEIRPVSSWTAATRTLALDGESLAFDFTDTSPLLRWYRCWPALRMPADALSTPPITNERGLWADVSLTLEVEPQIHYVDAPAAGNNGKITALADGTAGRARNARPTLEMLMREIGAGGVASLLTQRPRPR